MKNRSDTLAKLLFIMLLGIAVLPTLGKSALFPKSDPSNAGNWELNTEVSDEFDASELNLDKWFVQGTADKFHKWKGRAPSQFAPHNVKVEDGKLKLTSQWEPDYDFSDQQFDGRNYENITTAGVVSHKKFLYGYMEIKSKAADAAMTSSFWTLGYQSELDMFEQMGCPSLPQKTGFTNSYMFSIHDWRPGVVAGENKIFTHIHKLPYGVADGFHIYGCEWGEDYLKFYEDGNLVYETTQEELGDAWVVTNPLEIWFDSETFPWFGLPKAEDLPVDFEIEYVRIWQKPNPNMLERQLFGFEGPIVVDDVKLPTNENNLRKFWYIADDAAANFSITGEWFSKGRKSLKFEHNGSLKVDQVTAFSPYKSVVLDPGTYTLSMKIWIAPGSEVQRILPILEQPWLQLPPIELTDLARGQWVTVTKTFTREEASGEKDRLRITVDKKDIPAGTGTVYIDDISMIPQ